MKHLSDAEFDEFINQDKTVIIDFWADWCAPCRMIAPVFEELSKEFAGKIEFAKLDTAENPETPSKYGIVSIPAFLVFRKGELIGQFFGAVPKSDFKERLREFS